MVPGESENLLRRILQVKLIKVDTDSVSGDRLHSRNTKRIIRIWAGVGWARYCQGGDLAWPKPHCPITKEFNSCGARK